MTNPEWTLQTMRDIASERGEFIAVCLIDWISAHERRLHALESQAPAPGNAEPTAELPDLIVRIYAYIQRAARAAAYADADGSDTIALNSLIREARDLWEDGKLRSDLAQLLKGPKS